MDPRRPPETEEGWYALHDFRTVDWDAWREAPERERERAIEEGIDYLEDVVDVDGVGGSALFSITGHKADIMVLHLRSTLAAIERLERQFEKSAFARFTDQPSSYVSVTEVSGYMHEDISGGVDEIEDDGLRNYIQSRLHPDLPDAEHVCFYPMDKRRGPEDNWYDLPFEERAELMSGHGDIGREYAGRVTQIITGSVGLDDHEWGVTLFADDLVDIKHLLYEMRFDPSSSRYAEFGDFYVGRRFPPTDLKAYLAGEHVPTSEDGDGDHEAAIDDELAALGLDPARWAGDNALVYYATTDADELREEVDGMRSNFEHYDRHVHTAVETTDDGRVAIVSVWTAAEAVDTAGGFLADLPGVEERLDGPVLGESSGDETEATHEGSDEADAEELRDKLADLGIYAGQPHGEDVYALVLYSSADVEELHEEVDGLRQNFEHYDTHLKTAVYRAREGDRTAVVSIWETESAADTAGGFLAELPGVQGRAGDANGFGTMGMFYTVQPGHRREFVEKFDEVDTLLADTDGHRETDLMVNVEDENDMFIASRWRSREDALAFFRSDTFSETVSWGREVLSDRPRHVFLA